MTNINLLPWREHKREQQKKVFFTLMAFAVGFAVCLVIAVDYYANSLVEGQDARNSQLKNEIIVLDGRIKQIAILKKVRKALISRLQIVKNLESTRPLTVHLFDEIIKIMPVGVVVTKIERANDNIIVWGNAESNATISDLMRNIENNQWIDDPDLTEIKKASEAKQAMDNEFKLSFILKNDTMKDRYEY